MRKKGVNKQNMDPCFPELKWSAACSKQNEHERRCYMCILFPSILLKWSMIVLKIVTHRLYYFHMYDIF